MKRAVCAFFAMLLLSACVVVNTVQEKPIAIERLFAYKYAQPQHVPVNIVRDQSAFEQCYAAVMLENAQNKKIIAKIGKGEKATVYLPIGESWLTVLPDPTDNNPVCHAGAQSTQHLLLDLTDNYRFILIKSKIYENVYLVETNIPVPPANITTKISSTCEYSDYYFTDNLEKRTCPNKAAITPTYSGGAVYVRGYYRKDGTYVRPHTRSRPRR